MEPVVSLHAAAVAVGGRSVWSGVDIDVRPGEFVAILGPNGAGKSTLLKTVLGQVPLARGSASVLGAAPGTHNRRVGYLPQRRAFDAAMPLRGVDLVRLGLDGDRWGLPLPGARSREARQRVEQVIARVGATPYARRRIGECSGGEQQRLLIAQALVRRPDLLLLDEPLDSLDVTNQASVAALVRDICHGDGVAVLLVAHDVNPLLPYLDKVVYVAHGSVVMGRPEDVITPETLTALYGTPVDVLRDRTGRLVVVGQPDAHPGEHREVAGHP
jgi:zinc/manganese transport system ATP-binding protein